MKFADIKVGAELYHSRRTNWQESEWSYQRVRVLETGFRKIDSWRPHFAKVATGNGAYTRVAVLDVTTGNVVHEEHVSNTHLRSPWKEVHAEVQRRVAAAVADQQRENEAQLDRKARTELVLTRIAAHVPDLGSTTDMIYSRGYADLRIPLEVMEELLKLIPREGE